jgi:hypothetical protein
MTRGHRGVLWVASTFVLSNFAYGVTLVLLFFGLHVVPGSTWYLLPIAASLATTVFSVRFAVRHGVVPLWAGVFAFVILGLFALGTDVVVNVAYSCSYRRCL